MTVGTTRIARQYDRAQRRALRTRDRLLTAGLTVFATHGVDAATIEQVTERADLGKGTFYRHFASKNDLRVALVEVAVDHLVERIQGVVSASEPRTLEQLLEALLDAHSSFFVTNSEEFVLLFQAHVFARLQQEALDDLEQPYERYLQGIEQQVSLFITTPVDRRKVRRLACAVAGFVFGFLSFATIGMSSMEIEASLAPLRLAFVAGLSTFLSR